MAEHRDISFESLLRNTLRAEAHSLPVSVGPADILRRRDQRQRERSRRQLRLLLIAALIVLPLGALAVGVLRPDSPPEGYSAVLVRGFGDAEIQVFAAREGIAERVLTVPRSRLDDAGILDAAEIQVLETSATGWIAMYVATDAVQASGYREFVVLLNVRDPDAVPVAREGTNLGAWTPGGLYWSATNSAYELIDPASGQVIRLPRSASGEFDWYANNGRFRMQVAANGHGLLLGGPQKWGVLSADGTLSAGLPDVAEGVGPRGVSSQWGLLQPRYAPPPHHFLADASWAVDGGVWLLVDRRSDGRTMLLIHRDQGNVDREVATFPVDTDMQVSIGDLAPDDSLIAFELISPAVRGQTVIVDTRSGRSHMFSGAIGGFVPTAATADWVTGERLTEAGQELSSLAPGGGSGPSYGSLPSLQQQTASLFADRILLVHEVEATSADPGPAIQLTLGPVELDEGIGISLACSGPGEITLTEIAPGELPSTYTCLSPTSYHGHEAPNVTWKSAMVQVEYDPSTTWRLIVYDPPPRTPRP